MRQTKFRGQRHNGSWVYGCLGYSEDISSAIYFQKGAGKIKTMDFIYVKPESVGEFTGLTDKNREMWESDLYELLLNGIETHTELVLYEIRWNDKVAGFGFFKITKDSEQPEWIGLNDRSALNKMYKGNIHQDKNLLK